MTWNYRLAKKTVTSFECTLYGVVEAYYNEDGSIWATSENFQDIGNLESLEDVLWTLRTMLKDAEAAEKDQTLILDLDTIVYAKPDWADEDMTEYHFGEHKEGGCQSW